MLRISAFKEFGTIAFILSLCVTSLWAGTLQDDFDDGNIDGWRRTLLGDRQTQWSVRDGELVSISQNICPPDIASGLAIGEMTWQNYQFSCQFKIERLFRVDCGRVNLGVAIRSREGQVLNEIAFGVNSKDGVAWRAVCGTNIAGKWKRLHQGQVDIQPKRWYTLRVEANENQHQLHIDDRLICRFQSDLPKKGRVLVWGGNGEIHFDHVVITGDDIPNLNLSPLSGSRAGRLATTWGRLKQLHVTNLKLSEDEL